MSEMDPVKEPDRPLSAPRVIFAIGFLAFVLGLGLAFSAYGPCFNVCFSPSPDIATPSALMITGVVVMVLGLVRTRRARVT